MPDDYYNSDSGDGEEKPMDKAPDEEDSSAKQTFLVPKSALMGAKKEPGDECKFKVVHDYGEEIEFEYVKHDEKPDSSMGAADSQMDEMASANMASEET